MKTKSYEFVRQLVRHVRDPAIQESDIALRPDCTASTALRWRSLGVVRADVVIPDVVDSTLFWLLRAIDEGQFKLLYVPPDGEPVDLTDEGLGELAGWYLGDLAELSSERVPDGIGTGMLPSELCATVIPK